MGARVASVGGNVKDPVPHSIFNTTAYACRLHSRTYFLSNRIYIMGQYMYQLILRKRFDSRVIVDKYLVEFF